MGRFKQFVLVGVFAAALAVPAVAQADTGALGLLGCLTTDSDTPDCTPLGTPTANANNTPLYEMFDVAVSPDGTSVYGVSFGSSAIVRFDRDPTSGALTYQGCITGDTNVTTCSLVPGADAGAVNEPIQVPTGVAVSPDGAQVYLVNRTGGAIITFDRGSSGALTYRSCISDDTNVAECTHPPGAGAGGAGTTGLTRLLQVVVSADGSSVYTAGSSGVTRLDRAADGTLTYRGCVSSRTSFTSCTAIPNSTPNGDGSPLERLSDLVVSDDGRNIYTSSDQNAAISRFDRDSSGAITYQGCLSANSAAPPFCTLIPGATSGAAKSPMGGPSALTVSPDGKTVYVAGSGTDSLVRFTRTAGTGAIGFTDCITNDPTTPVCTQTTGALHGAYVLTVSPDNRSVYVASVEDEAVVRFDRDAATGAVTYRDCLSSSKSVKVCATTPLGSNANGIDSLFYIPYGITVSPDGKNVYVVNENSSSIATLSREPAPSGGGGGGGGGGPSNDFTIDRLIKNKKKGTAKVIVTVPGPGELDLTGAKAKESKSTATGSGDYFLRVKAAGKTRKKLRHKGKAKLKVSITYTPEGGTANSLPKKLKLVRKP